MSNDALERRIQQAIDGNADALAWITARMDASDDPVLLALAALLALAPDAQPLLDRAAARASSREDRQLLAIARAHLAGDGELVDALARDHLVDFPRNHVVAWLAAGGG